MPLPPSAGSGVPAAARRERADACPGALRLHTADDGALARVRLPAGLLTPGQATALALAARELGDGELHLTSRGNVQLRGLGTQCAAELAGRLRGAGLLPSDRHERARNIIASPLAGLDGAGHAPVQRWARRLDVLLCASEEAAGLSGRFLFAVDDGRGDVLGAAADVALLAREDASAVLFAGSDGPGLLVAAEDAPHCAVLAAEEFLTLARAAGTGAWRVRDLPAGHELSPFRLRARFRAAGIEAEPTALARPLPAPPPRPGPVAGPDGRCALSVAAPLGRVSARALRLLAATAVRHGAAQLRVTPWRGVVVPGLPRAAAGAGLAELADAGFVTDAASPWHGVSACTGRPGCARSLADVRADAADAVGATGGGSAPGESGPPDGARLLPVHWSGCERRCGRPAGGRWVDVLADGSGYRVDVRSAADGGQRERPAPGQGLTGSRTADAVAAARGAR